MMASSRALLRIREEMTERRISQRDLAATIGCTQSRIAKILTRGVNLRVDDLDALAKAVGISLTESVRDRGLEFQAEMTPSELRVLERIRQRPHVMSALLTLLDVTELLPAKSPLRSVPKRHVGRPRHSERTP